MSGAGFVQENGPERLEVKQALFERVGAVTGPDVLIEIYDSAGNLVDSLDGSGAGGSEELDFTAPTDGTYYVNVAGYLAGGRGISDPARRAG